MENDFPESIIPSDRGDNRSEPNELRTLRADGPNSRFEIEKKTYTVYVCAPNLSSLTYIIVYNLRFLNNAFEIYNRCPVNFTGTGSKT